MTKSSGVRASVAFIVSFAAQLCVPAQTTGGADRMDPAAATPTQPYTIPYTPMTGSERVMQFLKDSASPNAFLSSAASAGLGQWRDRPHEWKQGWDAYGTRYESSFAEHIVRETLKAGSAAMFHEDDRYYRSEEPGSGARIGHAVSSTFLARDDHGARRFSFSRIGAIAGAALISRLWQPHSTSSLRSAGVNFTISLGVSAGMNVAREFWPHK